MRLIIYENIKRIRFPCLIFSLSIWMAFFAIEGSFTVQNLILPFVIVASYYIFIYKGNFRLNKRDVILIFLLITFLISDLINISINHDSISIDIIIKFAYYVFIFLWYILITQFVFSAYEIKFAINSYILFAFVSSIIMIAQYFNGVSGKITITSVFGNRIGPNYFCALISIAAVLAAIKLLNTRPMKKKALIFNLFSFFTITFSVFISGSRGGFLAFTCSLIITYIIYISSDISFKKTLVAIIILIIGVIFGIFIIGHISSFTYNRYFVSSYDDYSNMDRIYRWKNAVLGIFQQPLFGFGPGFFANIKKYQITDFGVYINSSTPAHNTYLDIMIDGGIIGLLLFIYFLIKIYLPYLKRKNIVLLPVIISLTVSTGILGASKEVYFWHTLLLLSIIYDYMMSNNRTIKELLSI